MLNRGDEFFHPAKQRPEQPIATGALMIVESAQHAAMPGFRIDEPREERSNRKRIDVPRVDSTEQRFRDRGDSCVAEAPPKKRSDRLIIGRAPPSNQRFYGEAHPRAW